MILSKRNEMPESEFESNVRLLCRGTLLEKVENLNVAKVILYVVDDEIEFTELDLNDKVVRIDSVTVRVIE